MNEIKTVTMNEIVVYFIVHTFKIWDVTLQLHIQHSYFTYWMWEVEL